MEHAKKSALNNARERFCAGLVKRGQELRPLIAAFSSDPTARVPRAALQRRLHTLLASAQLFDETALVELLQTVVNRLDAVGLAGEPWLDADRQSLFALVEHLAGPGGAGDESEFSDLEGIEPESQAPREMRESGQRLVASEPETGGALAAWTAPPMPSSHDVASGVLMVRVLLVCSRPHAVSLRALLEDAPVELLHAADPEEALRLLHSAAPACALVAAEFATLPDIDLVRHLRMDPRGHVDGVYLLLPGGGAYDADFVRNSGADGVLTEPLTVEAFEPLLERTLRRRGRGGLRKLSANPEGTVDEIASYVAEEVRIGIAEGLRAGLAERIHLSDTTELTAAAWSAIGRVRAHLAQQSQGRVAFPGDAAISGAHLAKAERAASAQPSVQLAGRRVLVADDDPAVLWFMTGILREAGADVLQAEDGRAALDLARRTRPHAIVTDILMPKLDGFALCRELRRDVLLERVPVILLSWKDALFERMRELDPGANGFLRKDASGDEVLSTVARVLAPRLQLTAALQEAGEVSGHIEDIGIVALLETVAQTRPDALISVHDNWSVFEIALRDGRRVTVTRTSTDGSFLRSERALVLLLGVTLGTFTVVAHTAPLRDAHATPLAAALQVAGSSVSAALDAVSAARVEQVALLAFDEDMLAQLLSDNWTRLDDVVARFRTTGTTAETLLAEGSYTRAELEGYLRDLARRGAITGVWNQHGDDLLAEARAVHAPAPTSVTPLLADTFDEFSPEILEPAPEAEPETLDLDIDVSWSDATPTTFPPRLLPDPTVIQEDELEISLLEADLLAADLSTPSISLVALHSAQPLSPTQSRALLPEPRSLAREGDAGTTLPMYRPSLLNIPTHQAPPVPLSAFARPLRSGGVGYGEGQALTALRPLRARRKAADDLDLRTVRLPRPTTILVAAKRRREGPPLWLTLAAVGALGYVGARQLDQPIWMQSDIAGVLGEWALQRQQVVTARVLQGVQMARGFVERNTANAPATAAIAEQAAPHETSLRTSVDPDMALSVTLPHIDDSRGVTVAADQGLLVIEHVGPTARSQIVLDGKALGMAPLAVPLSATQHQLQLLRDGTGTRLQVPIYAGKTSVITLPLPSE
ncbi:MAG: hypothetical protein RL701_5778 [Pseudomonadota bacterium]